MRLVEDGVGASHPELTAAFRAWFGNSTVVDRQGQPLIVYHGTGMPIEAFKGMIWATHSPTLADDYSAMRGLADQHPNILPLFMKIEHPFNADLGMAKTVTVGSFFNTVLEQAADSGLLNDANSKSIGPLIDVVRQASKREESGPHFDRHNFWNEANMLFGQDGAAAILQVFKVIGFDGIQMIENGVLTFGAFQSTQVKSISTKAFIIRKTHASVRIIKSSVFHRLSIQWRHVDNLPTNADRDTSDNRSA